jgi:hypothetical protein
MSEYYDVPAIPSDHGEAPQPGESTDGDISTVDFSMTAPVMEGDVAVAGVDPVLGLPFWHPDAAVSPMTAPDGTEASDGYVDTGFADGTEC